MTLQVRIARPEFLEHDRTRVFNATVNPTTDAARLELGLFFYWP
jgi:hypothetical protein